MGETVALTGGTGFIGSEIIRLLNEYGFRIKALVRKKSIHKLSTHQVEQVIGDIFNTDALKQLVIDANFVINCAGDVRGISKSSFMKTNVEGLRRLVQSMEKYNQDARLLHFSSLAAQRPNVSPYAFSKWHSEEILRQMDNTLQWTLFRPSVVYGPGDTEVIPLLKWMRVGFFPIVGKAENRFSMLHVHDLARAVVTWIKSENCNSATYELHDGKINGYSWREIIQTMSWLYGKHIKPFHVPVSFVYSCAYLNIAVHGILGKKPMFSPGKVCELLQSGWVCDNAYFTKHTGWRPEIDLEKGVRELAGGRMRTNEGNKS